MQDPTIPNNQPMQPGGTQVMPNGVVQNTQSPPLPQMPATGMPPMSPTPQVAPTSPLDTSKPEEKKTEAKPGEEKKQNIAKGKMEVKKSDIEKVVSSWTGIPITKLTEDEGAKLLQLENRIHQRLIDQEEAVTAVSEAVRRGRIGLASANRPIASFIFLGPSGTGKTELAKTLAQILFGKDDALIRLDMSEYMEKHEVAKLIGAPPGYVGYEEGGQLTEAVRAKPYSIVLLDEVEKAHPDVFNILLQVLEDGRLTDNKGNTISFKNTIVICTSNIGSALITQKLGEKEGKELSEGEFVKEFTELTTLVNGELRKFFRPELLNRFDDIVIFKPLRRQDMAAIAKLGIEKTSALLKEQDIKLKISEKAVAQLSLEGYDPIYGARPLRRLIQTSIENPIAVLIIAKTFIPGDTIMIDYDTAKSDYSFRKATPEEIAAADKKMLDDNAKKDSGLVLPTEKKVADGKEVKASTQSQAPTPIRTSLTGNAPISSQEQIQPTVSASIPSGMPSAPAQTPLSTAPSATPPPTKTS